MINGRIIGFLDFVNKFVDTNLRTTTLQAIGFLTVEFWITACEEEVELAHKAREVRSQYLLIQLSR